MPFIIKLKLFLDEKNYITVNLKRVYIQNCIHNRRKNICKECKGNQICVHNRIKNVCKNCKGGSICVHNNRKTSCKECIGGSICDHNKLKRLCKECKGNGICLHNIQKYFCRECDGSVFCVHNIRKSYCKQCGGTALCKNNWCETFAKNPKYEGYCAFCFNNDPKNADKPPILRNFKTKEIAVRDYILERYPDFTWICDKKVQDGCSLRRPDLLLDLGYQVIIIEVDENQHISYRSSWGSMGSSCENKRLMEISKDINHRNLIVIRFNPDSYKTRENKTINSCWNINKSNGLLIISSKTNWNSRLKVLEETLKYWINNETNKMIEIVELFYDGFEQNI